MAEWTKEQIIARIRGEATKQGVDPDLALAVANQESYLNPNAKGDNGNSLGLFQLQPAAAIDVGVNPQWRHEPGVNIYGGVSYLKQKLTQAKGNVEDALRRYNGGGDPHYVQNVMRFFKPGVAEASERPQAGTYSDADVQNALQALQGSATPQATAGGTYSDEDVQNALRALGGTTELATRPSPPTATSTPEQDAASRDWAAQPAGREGPYTPAGEQQPSDLVIDITKPETHQSPGGVLPLPPADQPLEERLTAPSTLIPLLMGGAGIKAVARALPEAGPLLTRGARAVAEGLGQTLGWGAGRTIETGQMPSPGEMGTEAALNVAAGGILEGLGATGQALLRRSQAGKAIVAADEATTAARVEFEQASAQARAAQQAGRTEAYQTAARRARAAQAQYQEKVQARDATIAANEQTYQEALAAHRADVQAAQAERYGQARTQTMAETATSQARQQQYQQAVTGQREAITQARATPGRYTPDTPSWVLYEKYGDAAKDAVVDLTPARAALAEVRASRGVLPDGTVRPFPTQVETLAANLEKATGETNFQTIRDELRRLAPLTRSQDSNVRGAAKQVYGIYADVLEASPVANDLLRQANATFRKEMAVQDIAEWLRPGHGIVRIDNQGRETINVGALMTRLEKTVGDDALFRRSFAPDELDALRQDLRQLAGTPTMPRGGRPTAATPARLPGTTPDLPASMQRPPTPSVMPREVARPRQDLLPGGAGPGRRVAEAGPEPGPVTPRDALGDRPKIFTGLTRSASQDYLGTLLGIPPGAVMGSKALWRLGQQGRYGVARLLLSAQGRPQLMQTLREFRAQVGPRLYGAMVHGLSAEERKALLRETRETREKTR